MPFTWELLPANGNLLVSQVLRLTPLALLSTATTHTVTVTGVKDAAGNTLAAPYAFSFTTGINALVAGQTTITAVTVNVGGVQTQLTNGQIVTGVAKGSSAVVTFSRAVTLAG